jgi:hypothetical protein
VRCPQLHSSIAEIHGLTAAELLLNCAAAFKRSTKTAGQKRNV